MIAFNEILSALNSTSSTPQTVAVSGITQSVDTFFVKSCIENNTTPLLIITADQKEADRFYEELVGIEKEQLAPQSDILLFPTAHNIPYSMRSPFGPIQERRLETLTTLLKGTFSVLIAPSSALLEQTLPPQELFRKTIRLEVQDDIAPQKLITWLHEAGFQQSTTVTDPGSYALRGGILDIYPLGEDNPVRIEFWGDTIDSIRSFDIFKQRTIKALRSVEILPMKEFLPHNIGRDNALEKIYDEVVRKRLPMRSYEMLEHSWSVVNEIEGLEWYTSWFEYPKASLFEYLPPSITILYNDYLSPTERYTKDFENYRQHRDRIPEIQKPFVSSPAFLLHTSDLIDQFIASHSVVYFKSIPKSITANHFDFIPQPLSNGDISLLAEDLRQKEALGYTTTMVCENSGLVHKLTELITEHRAPLPHFEIGILRTGFSSSKLKIAYYSERQIFDRQMERRFTGRSRQSAPIVNFDALTSGDVVVHVDHGIAKYRGIQEISIGDFKQDCLVLEYKDNAKIHVPITDFHKVQKYIGKDSSDPTLSKLGSSAWEKKKERTRQLLQEMAAKMVKLYAKREYYQGVKIGPDTLQQKEFEESFLYTPTPDQLSTMDAIKLDMESATPMDRLVCGDVGFGKTEVAMRAAFKAVQDGYQVAVLAPTTVLASQHGHTFLERMSEFSINIAVLSRLNSAEEARNTIAAIKSGDVQIIIGTHKILSKKIEYANLGLVIIDEEQRFGVKQKDQFTKLRHSINMLSMSATPIPRTLHMSMAGIRDLSLINTPPQNRLPIETVVAESHDELIQQALLNELERGGQSFVVLNRISGLNELFSRIELLVPQARIAVAHGQMEGDAINDIMERFTAGDFDILLSTTIIENGIDISNANTIIVEKSDLLGLSQLYQLRGRVGRSVEQGYAFFLVNSFKQINDQSLKRLKALEQYTDLGSGFQLAMRDLELRGAGNLLGTDQSGSIASVGFELYCQLLKEEITRLRENNAITETPDPELAIGMQGYFSSEYIADSNLRILLYQRATSLTTLAEVKTFESELADRFGAHPIEVSELLLFMEIKIYARRFSLASVTLKKQKLILEPAGAKDLVQQSIAKLMQLPKANFKLKYSEKVTLTTKLPDTDAFHSAQNIKNILRQALRVELNTQL